MRQEVRSSLKLLPLFSQGAIVLLMLAIAACSKPETDAVRHLVIAELIQRERVPESTIVIISIRFPAPDIATVEANILTIPAKSVDPTRRLVCQLQKENGRWKLDSVRNVNEP
jgi:hypothetical protein